jgi:hypothetical protein
VSDRTVPILAGPRANVTRIHDGGQLPRQIGGVAARGKADGEAASTGHSGEVGRVQRREGSRFQPVSSPVSPRHVAIVAAAT